MIVLQEPVNSGTTARAVPAHNSLPNVPPPFKYLVESAMPPGACVTEGGCSCRCDQVWLQHPNTGCKPSGSGWRLQQGSRDCLPAFLLLLLASGVLQRLPFELATISQGGLPERLSLRHRPQGRPSGTGEHKGQACSVQ